MQSTSRNHPHLIFRDARVRSSHDHHHLEVAIPLQIHRDLQKSSVRLPCRQLGHLNTFDNKNRTRFADIAIQGADPTKVLRKDSDPLERNSTQKMQLLGFAK